MSVTPERPETTAGSAPIRGLLAAVLAASLAACAGEPGQEGDTAAEADGQAGRAVHFVQPEDGATVTSPVEIEFGSRGVRVDAVPDTVETPREGVIHYHLGVDTDCLAPGTRIPSADPWIHFGDGSNSIETQLAPGQHRLTVQAGNDEHVTLEGLCETISITVEEGQGGTSAG